MSRRLRVIAGGLATVDRASTPSAARPGGVHSGTAARLEREPDVDPARVAELSAAREEGSADGYVRGFEAGQKAAEASIAEAREQLSATIDELAAEFARQRDGLEHEAVEAALRAGIEIARRILEREVAIDPTVVLANLESCLERLGGATEIEIRLNPADLEWLSESGRRPTHGRARIRYQDDPSIARGGCEVVSDAGRIDGRISSQLRAVTEQLGGLALDAWASPVGGDA